MSVGTGWQVGELYADSAGALFYCTVAGSPGAWVPVVGAGGEMVITSDVQFTSLGAGTYRNMHTSGNTSGLRLYAADALTTSPAGATLQLWGNASSLPGQAFVDSGAVTGAAIVFRTAPAGGGITTRMTIDAQGAVSIPGSFSVSGSKNFVIDHPLDPENRLLYHSSVEAPEQLNVYSGNVTTDAQGNATVQLPDYFEALNRDYRYQLTVVGQFAQAIVASKIQQRRFTIRTDKPGVEVSWQVSGIRDDAAARAEPFVADRPKPADERGTYLRPKDFGQPESRGVHWRRSPEQVLPAVAPSPTPSATPTAQPESSSPTGPAPRTP